MRNVARQIVSKFGSQQLLAHALGTSQTTVAYWVKTGRIPSKWHAEILTVAQEAGVDLSPADLVPAPANAAEPGVPIARYEGTISFGPDDTAGVRCYVLDDGRRVISRTSAVAALGGKGGDLTSYIRPVGLALRMAVEDELVDFHLKGVTSKRVQGVTAECFMDICKAFVAARDVPGMLTTDRQSEIARQASAFISACATLGLISLIDEVTGYQYAREKDALQVKLRAYLEEEMRPWEKTFPDELWQEFGRLTNWEGTIQQRPKYWGKLVNELVYSYLDRDVFEWLRDNAPAPRHGQNYHQWLSSQYGLKRLVEHLWQLIGLASACQDIGELRYRMAIKYGKQPVQIMLMLDAPASN